MSTDSPANDHGNSDDVREEEFTARGALEVAVHLVSGDLTVRTGTSTTVQVRVTASGARARQRLADTTIEFDEAKSTLAVRSPLRSGGTRKWSDFVSNGDIDVELVVPEGSSLDCHSASGDVVAMGNYDAIEFASASGDLAVDQVNDVRVNSASGDVVATRIASSVKIKCSSGDVQIAQVAGDAHLVVVSGDVNAYVDGPGVLDVHAVSGDVTVGIREGLTVAVDAKSVSGDLRSDIELSDSGSLDDESDGRVDLKIVTVSGDVRIRRGGALGDGVSPFVNRLLQRIGRIQAR
jgi:DUF4097 and DUF4098 domain-containing protein YvlB